MTPDAVLAEFRDAGALLEGHFVLSSGLHSGVFLQKMAIFSDPVRTERLCKALAEVIVARFGPIDIVVSPAIGGIVPGYETARHLGARAIFVERDPGGPFSLRRGFSIPAGQRAVIVEDIVTTGLSARECLASLQSELRGGHRRGLPHRPFGRARRNRPAARYPGHSRHSGLCCRCLAAGTCRAACRQAG